MTRPSRDLAASPGHSAIRSPSRRSCGRCPERGGIPAGAAGPAFGRILAHAQASVVRSRVGAAVQTGGPQQHQSWRFYRNLVTRYSTSGSAARDIKKTTGSLIGDYFCYFAGSQRPNSSIVHVSEWQRELSLRLHILALSKALTVNPALIGVRGFIFAHPSS